MTNPYYVEMFQGREHALAEARHVESELQRIQAAFDRVAPPGTMSGLGAFFTTRGPVNAYVVDIDDVTSYEKGLNFLVCFHEVNTGPSTLAVNTLPAVDIFTLFGNALDAGDLRGIRRLTYFDSAWRMQTIAPSDIEDAAEDAVIGIVTGPPGIPGASTVFDYNTLLTAAEPTALGQYRFLMSPTGTAGVNSDMGLRLAMALEIADVDADSEGRDSFYDEVEVGDIVTLYIGPRRWYAYAITNVETPRTTGTHLWAISPLAHENSGGTGDLAAGTAFAVGFRWSRARAAIGGVPGVTGDNVLPELDISYHAVPSDYTTDPLTWLPNANGFSFRNNAGPAKVLVASIRENGELLSNVQHAGYLYQWSRDGALFTPSVDDPILMPTQTQITTRRFLVVDARDIADGGANQFSCTVCLA